MAASDGGFDIQRGSSADWDAAFARAQATIGVQGIGSVTDYEPSPHGPVWFLGRVDGTFAGAVWVRSLPEWAGRFWTVEILFVEDRYRRCGIGSGLLAAVMADARIRGIRGVMLSHWIRATALGEWYEHRGFSAVEPGGTLTLVDLDAKGEPRWIVRAEEAHHDYTLRYQATDPGAGWVIPRPRGAVPG